MRKIYVRRRLISILVAFGMAAALGMATAATASANDGPTGFWYGTDSGSYGDASTPPGGSPYVNPFQLGGHYGGYIGEIGGWWTILGGGTNQWNGLAAAYAEDNHRLGDGIGTTGYWMLGGPGKDTALSAYNWGHEQGLRAVTAWRNSGSDLPLIWMDVETGQGWYGSGSATTNRDDFNGFFDAVSGSGYMVGVYSSDSFWKQTFGTGAAAQIPHTYEWTAVYEYGIGKTGTGPYAWCHGSTCAQFFGGQSTSSACALMWQWTSTASGVNSPGDVDQIDSNRLGSAGCV